ncbi:hypothetical protein P7K49_003728 [Saguinus oedipus]|uniref:Uncharacterized protein n=1 Tax=Saguinus oedipus TaxID=9490 RepID=A0ABQ9W8V4_SAGOE|nr:hypothetical protein P7K49_003728 [Saguinus oedipus]
METPGVWGKVGTAPRHLPSGHGCLGLVPKNVSAAPSSRPVRRRGGPGELPSTGGGRGRRRAGRSFGASRSLIPGRAPGSAHFAEGTTARGVWRTRGREELARRGGRRTLRRPAPVPAPSGRRLQSDWCLAASTRCGTMKLPPSVVLKLFLAAGKRAADAPGDRGDGGRSPPARATWWGPCALAEGLGGLGGCLMRPGPSPAVLSALVTGESLERLRRGLAAGTSNPDPPTGSTDQLLPLGGGRDWKIWTF